MPSLRINAGKASSCGDAVRSARRVWRPGAALFLHTQRMGSSTIREQAPERAPSTASASVYWRRRFVTLLIGLAVLALVAWAFAGALGANAPVGNPAATLSVAGTMPPLRTASHGPAPGKPAAAAATGRDAGRTAGSVPSGSQGGIRPCPAGDVVLTLFSSQASYSTTQTPEFEVDVVSTANRICTFDIGAAHVLLQISDRSGQVWTSAECAEGQASLVTRLHRGVPTIVPIGWDDQRSSPGCPVPGPSAPDGPYTAVASDHAQRSNVLSFRIG
jgi:hypothetical protein